MIVICPGCTSRFRVRDEAMPPEGARVRCPKCSALFSFATPPSSDKQAAAVRERATAPAHGSTESIPPGTDPSAPTRPADAPLIPSPPRNPFSSSAGSNPFASAPPGAVAPTAGDSDPFAASGSDPFAASGSDPFAAIGSDPFAATGSDPFAASGSDPFAAVPSAPLTAGAEHSPAAAASPPPGEVDEDPFAGIDLDAGPSASSPPRAPAARLEPGRPGKTLAPRPPSARAPERHARAGPSLAARVGSALVLGLSGGVLLAGLTVAGWSRGWLDLDAKLMPYAEQLLGVRPPRSYLGRDDPPLEGLEAAALEATERGDAAAAAVAWRRYLQRAPSDRSAQEKLGAALAAVGERRRAQDVLR